MAKEQANSHPGFKQEALAVIGVFLAVFLFLSLFSSALHSESNWCGEVGKVIADLLFGFVGWGCYLFVALLLCSSVLFLFSKLSFERLPQLIAGLTGAVASFCGLLASFAVLDPLYENLGGFLGKLVMVSLHSVVGTGGMLLVLVLIFIISLMLAAKLSPYSLLLLVGHIIKKGAGLFSRRGGEQSTKEKKPKRRKKISGEKSELEDNLPAVSAIQASNQAPVVKELAQVQTDTEEEFSAQPIARGDWELPPLSLLTQNKQRSVKLDKKAFYKVSEQLEAQLNNFGVQGKVVGIAPGPVVTTYEYAPAPGVKINKIVGLADDLALGLKAKSVRVVGSIPGKAALGIEIPNELRQIVCIRDLLCAEEYQKKSDKLTIALGLDVVGKLAMANLAKMPHLLIAGATGAGKSVGINTIIASILYNATPEEVRFLMVDPKRIELSGYEGIPHLLHPVVVDPKMASRALNWAVREMERRYRLLEEAKVKGFDSYNLEAEEKLPYIVIIVDELADLMMVASKDVESSIARLAQMARAAGIHMILATQRPSVDVLTGLIKANFPTRISFKVSSKIDSRTILDGVGAEHLLGAGDMLFLPPGGAIIERIHGAYISEKETAAIVDFLKEQGESSYDETVMQEIEKETTESEEGGEEDYDARYDEAVAAVSESGQASISMVQRRLRVGYNRAARMIEMMEKEGIVGPADGAKPREVLVRKDYN